MESDLDTWFLKNSSSSYSRIDFWCLGFFSYHLDSIRQDETDLINSINNLVRLKVISSKERTDLIIKFIKGNISKDKRYAILDSEFIFLKVLADKIDAFSNIEPVLCYLLGKKAVSDLSLIKKLNQEIGPRNSFSFNRNETFGDLLEKFLEEKIKLESENHKEKHKEEQEESCVICYGTKDENVVPLDTCIHAFHQSCLVPYFKTLAEDKKQAQCPICKKKLNNNQARFLKASFLDSPSKKIILDEPRYPPRENFNYQQIANQGNEEVQFANFECAVCTYINIAPKDHFRIFCTGCQMNFCANCKVIWHEDMSCKEFKKWGPDGFHECPDCKNQQAKVIGMTNYQCINCLKHFCTKCGKKYGYNHKCS